jgi:hypothetical protein
VAGALVQDVPVEAGAELGPVVGLDDLDPERQPLQHIVQELDGGLLVELGIAAQHAQPGAVVDGGELVVRLGLGAPGSGWMNLTSSWTRWPGRGFSSRCQRRSWRLCRWDAGSRFSSSRFKILQTPELLICTSW